MDNRSMKRQLRVVILGATGSIGRQAVDVIKANPERFSVVGLSAGSDVDGLDALARELGVTNTVVGPDGAVALVRDTEADVVLNAIVGAAGLRATIAALEAGARVALANKESLVAGGEACAGAARRGGGSLVPVDSEHAALAQCLEGRDRATVARLIVTASGGPFRERSDLTSVTPEEALQHPTWSMGPKITIDSATLMNKGLEVIEAHYLFDFDYADIDIVVHPQSVIHGAIELVDGTLVVQAAPTDMRIPIQGALATPDRFASRVPPIDLTAYGRLDFEAPDRARFPCIDLAYSAGRAGRSVPAVMNAANEAAVGAFLEGRIGFTGIPLVIEAVMGAHDPFDVPGLDDVLAADAAGRRSAAEIIAATSQPVGRAR